MGLWKANLFDFVLAERASLLVKIWHDYGIEPMKRHFEAYYQQSFQNGEIQLSELYDIASTYKIESLLVKLSIDFINFLQKKIILGNL